jgi:hypothetical protein
MGEKMNGLALVRQYEPIFRFHQDENFYPMPVDNYLKSCSLHVIENKQGILCVPPPYVDIDDLPMFATTNHFLVYADRKEADEEAARKIREMLEREQAAKGLSFIEFKHEIKKRAESMGIDILNTFKPFAMPDKILKQAKENYGGLAQQSPTYYYRIIQEEGYTIIQYWFFYAYNDFLTTHGGSNDHEGDWECITLYLQEGEPAYAVYASHGGGGEHNRRTWDQLELIESHPVVYVGAGSHASYFTPELDSVEKKKFTAGEAVGPNASYPWISPQSLAVSWCEDYQGRWGARQWDRPIYEMGDSKGGPPTGPKFNRDGSIRLEWQDPLAYAALK